MADDFSKWMGGPKFIKLKKWGNGANNSVTPTHRKTRYRCGVETTTLGRMQQALHESAKARGTKFNPHGVPYF